MSSVVHATFNGLLRGMDLERFNRLLVFLGESYKVRTTRVGSGHQRYGIEVEEVGTSTIYKIEGRTIEQVCDSTVTHIIKDRVRRPTSIEEGLAFVATASGSSTGGMVISEEMLKEINDFMTKSFSFKASSWKIKGDE